MRTLAQGALRPDPRWWRSAGCTSGGSPAPTAATTPVATMRAKRREQDRPPRRRRQRPWSPMRLRRPTPAATDPPCGDRGSSSAFIYDPGVRPVGGHRRRARRPASADGKPVLLDFGADWCPDCVVLSRMFDDPSFADYLDGVHVVRIDVGYWDHNLDVSKQYGDPIVVGIPAVVLVSPTGETLGTTADGRLASAASMTPEAVLRVLQSLGS